MTSSLITALLHSFDDSLPLSQASTLPAECYVDPAFAQAEEENLFPNTWQYVCSLKALPSNGSFMRSWIGKEGVFAIRGDDGQPRVFSNVCRHRASPIIIEDCGNCTKLRCKYHGWTYDIRGALRGVPEFDGVDNFCREDNGLHELQSSICGDFLFARLQRGPDDLNNVMKPLIDRMAGQLDNLEFFRRVTFPVASNWKIYIDNYLDGGYHVNTVHPALAGSLDYKKYRTDLFEFCSVQTSPLTANDEDSTANRTRTGDSASYWWIYPNFTMNCYEGVMDVNYVIPRSVDTCDVVFDFFFADKGEPAKLDFREESIRMARQVQDEDDWICGEVQRNMRSRFYSQGRFSVKRENGGYHFHQMLARHLRRATNGKDIA